jgi:hypothetical protein
MSVRSRSHRLPVLGSNVGIAAACACCLVAAGCTKQQSTANRIKQAAESSGIKPLTVFPLAGTVTVDNQPPALKSKKWVLVVMAYDASKPDQPASNQLYVSARADGSFDFGDGLPPGKYVMLFAQLQKNKKRGAAGPDALKNLYNDPDVNAKKGDFTINHQEPGKTNYEFNLNVAGETAPAQHGPNALTHIAN